MWSNSLNKFLTSIISCVTTVFACNASPIGEEKLKQVYDAPLPKLSKQLNVFHLGHSLVGRDMPSMLKQFAGQDHQYSSQLGWGTGLQAHWEPDIPIKGFKPENAHPYYRDVFEAINSGEYDVFVLTESVEIKAAIKYKESAKYLAKFTHHIADKNPNARVYFYESWHKVNDKEGWVNRLNTDYKKYWLDKVLDQALSKNNFKPNVYVIPVGQVLSAIFTKLKSIDHIKGLNHPEDIFAIKKNGRLDPIHLNDLGNYIVAATHFAVIYQSSPVGLPRKLKKANGVHASAPSKEAAEFIQTTVWEVVSNDYRTGLIGY